MDMLTRIKTWFSLEGVFKRTLTFPREESGKRDETSLQRGKGERKLMMTHYKRIAAEAEISGLFVSRSKNTEPQARATVMYGASERLQWYMLS